jgi:hypothetical protein
MKLSFAVACLIGLASAEADWNPVWSLESVNYHRTDAGIQKDFGEHSIKMANARPPYQTHVQLDSEGKDEKVWQLSSVLGHRDDSAVQKGYGDFSTEKANARPPYQSHVQMDSESESESDSDSEDDANIAIASDKVIEKNPIFNAW